jgi:type I restriction enzyme, S subunit
MSKNKLVKLNQIAKVVQGQSPESIYYSSIEGMPFMQGNRTFGDKYPIIDTFTSKVTKMARKNDVLMSVRAPVGDLNIATCDLCIGRGLSAITSKQGNNEFLYYSLKYNVQNLLRQGSGTTYSSVNKDIINDFDLIVPKDENIWESISNLLSSLDSKIELNNKINKELETMAKTLYDYWFVQFDFPNENGKPYKSSGGKMVYNQELKREIPEGWDVDYVENILGRIETVDKIQTKDILKDGEIPVIDQSMDYISGFTNNKNSIIQSNEHKPKIIFGDHTRVVKFINFDFARGADGTQVLVSTNKKMPQHLLYHSILKIDLSNYGYARHYKFLKQSKIILPKISISEKYEQIVTTWFKHIKENRFQNIELANLRDWLLPMLMNGQVMVK